MILARSIYLLLGVAVSMLAGMLFAFWNPAGYQRIEKIILDPMDAFINPPIYNASDLVGRWRGEDSGGAYLITRRADGTYTKATESKPILGSPPPQTTQGKWDYLATTYIELAPPENKPHAYKIEPRSKTEFRYFTSTTKVVTEIWQPEK